MTEYFKKQPKTSGPHSPMVSNSTDGSNSNLNRVVKRWNDPQLERRKERRAKAEKERRARGTKSDSMKRTERVVEKIVQAEAERTGANLAVEAGRKSVVTEVMSMLKPQKKKPDKSTDDFGREQSLKPLSQNLYYGDLTATGKRKYSANDKIFFF